MKCFLTWGMVLTFCVSGFLFADSIEFISPYFTQKRSSLTSIDSINHATDTAFVLMNNEKWDEAFLLGNWALGRAEDLSYRFGQAESHTRLGSIFDLQEKYEQALFHHLKARHLREGLMEETDSTLYETRYVSTLNHLAIVYAYLGNQTEALLILKQGLQFVSEHPEWPVKKRVGCKRFLLHTMGTTYWEQGKTDSAADAYYKSLELAKPVDLHVSYTEITEYDLAVLLTELGLEDTLLDKLFVKKANDDEFLASIQEAKGQRLVDEGKNEEARAYFTKSLHFRKLQRDTVSIGMNFYNLAICYLNEGNYEEAKNQFDSAIFFYKIQGDDTRMAESLTSLGILASAKNKNEEALAYFTDAYALAQSSNALLESARIATQLVALYEKTNQLDSAFMYQKRYREHRDEINTNRESAIKTIEKSRRETEVEAQKLARAKERQRLTNIGAVIIISSLMILLYFIIRQTIQKRKIAEYKLKEKEVAKTYLQYQRKGILLERNRMARDIHDGLGQLLVSAKSSIEEIAKTADAKADILNQIKLAQQGIKLANENLHFFTDGISEQAYSGFGILGWAKELKKRIESSTDLKVEIFDHEIDRPLVEDAELQLIFVMQELVNNAQKYSKAEELTIQLIRDQDALNLTIEDDGDGFDVEKALRKSKRGIGLGSIKERVEERLGGQVIFDSVIGEGTSVIIDIPHVFVRKKTNT